MSTKGEERDVRVRQPTEKGSQWQLEVKQKNWKETLTSWKRKSNKLRSVLMDEDADMSIIKQHRNGLQDTMDRVIEAQEKLSAVAMTLSTDDSLEIIEEVEEEHTSLMKETYQALKVLRGDVSTVRSSLSSKKKQEQCQRWINESTKDNSKTQKSQAAVHHSKAEYHHPRTPSYLESGEAKPAKIHELDPNPEHEKASLDNTTKDAFHLLAESLRDQLHLNRLPLPEPSTFTGNPLHYPAWKNSYELLIEHSNIPAHERFFYLLKFLKGEPRELLEEFSMIGGEGAYFEARTALDKRYGDQFTISNAFREKLDRWPKIGARDSQGLRRFADYLRQCCTAMKYVRHLQHLDDERESKKLLFKLPEWLISRKGRIVISWRNEHQRFPPFCVFSKFIEDEATIACDPVVSLGSVKEDNQRLNRGRSPPSAGTMSTRTLSSDNGHKRTEQRQYFCMFCKKQHRLDECSAFSQQDLDARKTFIVQRGLCYGCLRKGHITKYCRRRSTCAVCKKRHPTPLHGDVRRPASNNDGTNTEQERKDGRMQSSDRQEHQSTSSCSMVNQLSSASSMIVPVWLSHVRQTEEKLIYALLDTQSDTTFLLESTKNEMGLRGVDVNLSLSTMSSRDERIPSERIEGLSVRAHDGEKRINLPPTYTRDIMPANREHVPTREVAQSISHLNKLSHSLLPSQDCEIGLLIGYDCAKALVPRYVIPAPHDDGPYGIKTDLGWSIVGTVHHDYERRNDYPIGISHRVNGLRNSHQVEDRK